MTGAPIHPYRFSHGKLVIGIRIVGMQFKLRKKVDIGWYFIHLHPSAPDSCPPAFAVLKETSPVPPHKRRQEITTTWR
jgi:hypothetical protein